MARSGGFTLMEMVVVIVILSVVAAMSAAFLRSPLQGYFDSISRARLVDIADTSLRRIARDVQAALPNSVRNTTIGGVEYLEFIPILGGGRYRAEKTSAGSGNALSFQSNNSNFDILSPALTVPATSYVAIFNLGIPGSDAYEGYLSATNVLRPATTNAASSQNIGIDVSNRSPFPFESPSRRFQLVSQPVTYACSSVAGTLGRYSNYGFNATQSAPAGTPALIASNVSAPCNFTYSGVSRASRAGLVTMTLRLTLNSETVSLAQEVHVNNVP